MLGSNLVDLGEFRKVRNFKFTDMTEIKAVHLKEAQSGSAWGFLDWAHRVTGNKKCPELSTRAWVLHMRLAHLLQAVALHHDVCWPRDVFRIDVFILTKHFEWNFSWKVCRPEMNWHVYHFCLIDFCCGFVHYSRIIKYLIFEYSQYFYALNILNNPIM